MTKYISKTKLIKKNSYLFFLKNIFCQAYSFNFQFNQDSFLAGHITFEKRKTLKKEFNEELMKIT